MKARGKNTLSSPQSAGVMAGKPTVNLLKSAAEVSQAIHSRVFKLLGVRGLQLRKATKNILEAAEKALWWP